MEAPVEPAAKDSPDKSATPGAWASAYSIGTRANVGHLISLYSQLAGVLAGFAFAGLSFYLTRSELPSQAAGVAVSLFTAFAALVIVAILYALLSGESPDVATRRVDASLLVYGLPFGLSIITLFYSLTLMATERPELAGMVGVGKFIVIAAAPLIVIGRLNIAAMDACGRRPGWQPYHFGWILVVALPALATVTLVNGPLVDPWPEVSAVYPAYIGLGTAVAAAVLSSIISTRRPDFELPRPIIYVYLVTAFVALASYSNLAAVALG